MLESQSKLAADSPLVAEIPSGRPIDLSAFLRLYLAAKEPKRLKAMSKTLVKLHREIKAEGPAWPRKRKK